MLSCSLVAWFQVLKGCYKVSQESSPGWTAPTCSACPHKGGVSALWSCLWSSFGLNPTGILILGMVPELTAALQRDVERVESPPSMCWSQIFWCSLWYYLLGCKPTVLAHVELLINKHLQIILLRAVFKLFFSQSVFMLEFAPTDMQDLALGLVEFHEIPRHPLLQPVKIPVDAPFPSSMSVALLSLVLLEICWGCIDPTVHVIDKAVKQCQSQYWPQKNPLITGLHLDNSLSVTLQPISYPPSDPSIKLMPPQFSGKDVDSVKCFADPWLLGQVLCIPPKLPFLVSTLSRLAFCVCLFFVGMHCSWAWRRSSLNINQLPWAPLTSKALSHGTLSSRSLKRSKSALLRF